MQLCEIFVESAHFDPKGIDGAVVKLCFSHLFPQGVDVFNEFCGAPDKGKRGGDDEKGVHCDNRGEQRLHQIDGGGVLLIQNETEGGGGGGRPNQTRKTGRFDHSDAESLDMPIVIDWLNTASHKEPFGNYNRQNYIYKAS